jgi:hypothetical protein
MVGSCGGVPMGCVECGAIELRLPQHNREDQRVTELMTTGLGSLKDLGKRGAS